MHFENDEIWKNNMFDDVSILFLYFLKCFGDKWEVHRAIFGENSGSSKNDPTSIGICPGTLISKFEEFKPKNTITYYLKTKKTKPTPIFPY